MTIKYASFFFAPAVLVATTQAQVQVDYGGPVTSGSITSATQVVRYLMNGQAGDVVRLAFASENSGWPNFTYYHQIDVSDAAGPVATVSGYGLATFTLQTSGLYSVKVKAINNASTGWYAFYVNRLNNPVGADRIAFDWQMQGGVGAATEYACYTIHGAAGASAELALRSEDSGWPNYTPYHYAELLDAQGNSVATVTGNAAQKPFSFPHTGVFTLYVGARDQQARGWFTASVVCTAWPFSPCDTQSYSGNYGQGFSGGGTVPTLTAATEPRIGAVTQIDVGNAYTQPATAVLLLSHRAASFASAFGGTLLLADPILFATVNLPAAPATQQVVLPWPNEQLLVGLGIGAQSIVIDPATPGQLAFSPGLLMVLGQ